MKKLMIAAAAAAMIGGAFAACQEDAACVYAYKLTLSGKTTVAFTVKGKASTCTEDVCYRKAGSFKIDGYIFGRTDATEADPDECIDASCGCYDTETTFESIFWNTKSKKEVVADFSWTQLNLIGKDKKQLEAVAKFNDLTLAGFGTYDIKKLAIKSISGNFAGQLDAPLCETCNYNADECEDECEETAAIIWDLCTLEQDEDYVETTAAFGKWTLKPNTAAVKKLTKAFDSETEAFDATVLAPKGFIAEDEAEDDGQGTNP
ncbi:MAG: hypothetical protein IKL02_10645 [Kiritimatiellae bacterium]|nr:hypothetical protein [Kiritimatiellia bacterium]MBR3778034.1 hypothetical protein [Kiritimatiellia bacterium]